MMPHLLRFASFALLGAITSVGVASYCLRQYDGYFTSPTSPAVQDVGLVLIRSPGGQKTMPLDVERTRRTGLTTFHSSVLYDHDQVFPTEEIPSEVWPGLFPWSCGDRTWPDLDNNPLDGEYAVSEYHALVVLAGWPFRSNWTTWCAADGGFESGALEIQNPDDAWRPLMLIPYRPLFGGFLANTAVFGLAWYVLFTTPIRLRQHLRLRRGLCPHCAYDLRATPAPSPCPECGRRRD